MDPLDALAILGAGLGAGVVITAIGAGSLVSFPILLGVGLSPVVANVCNTVGLVPGGLSGTWGYRRELTGKRGLVVAVAATTAVGALAGAFLLLSLPPGAFEKAVPALIIVAATLVGVQPWLSAWLRRRPPRAGRVVRDGALSRPLVVASSVTGVYGGYFGAGQGVMLVAFLALGLEESHQVVNGLKNVAVLAANIAASLVFVFVAPLDWAVVGLIALGSVVGGWLGAHLGRRLSPLTFRVLVVAFGYAVGVRLILSTWV